MTHTAENDARCQHCGSAETHVSYEDPSANFCRACRRWWRVITPEVDPTPWRHTGPLLPGERVIPSGVTDHE